MNTYDILIVSTTCSEDMYRTVSETRTKKSLDPAQRVFSALVNELCALGNDITCISAVPYSHNNTNVKEFERQEETVNTVRYIYPSFRMGIARRQVDLLKNGRFEINRWVNNKTGKRKIMICDSLVVPLCSEARKICQSKGIASIAYVTDYPSMATSIKSSGFSLKSIFQKAFDYYADIDIKKFDGYIVVAEKLIELIRPYKDRHIVVEDIAEIPTSYARNQPNNEAFTIIYGGALCKRFGINKLTDAIMLMQEKNIKMIFYGSGESVDYILEKAKEDNRIKYGGVVSFENLQIIQKKADLLINPRPSNEAFAGYSFPSKTTSYMLSGTPVLTTKIPGIPKDYFPHLLLFRGEGTEEMSKRIEEVIKMPKEELDRIGKEAFQFLVDNKGSKKQTERIVSFIDKDLT